MEKTFRRILWFVILTMVIVLLSACSGKSEDSNALFLLQNQNNQTVNIIQNKPALIFFFTTYT